MAKVQLPHSPNPSQDDAYTLEPSKRGRPMLFQITDPVGQPIWPFLLALHCNPNSLGEKYTKSKNVVMTYGGHVEFIWPDDLDSLSGSGSTGAFFGPGVGLTSGSDGKGAVIGGSEARVGAVGRHGTMAWERQEDLIDLFRNNGHVYDGNGNPVIRGQVMCIYDRGIYVGFFTNFTVKEDDSHAWSFTLDWEFRVEHLVYRFPFASVRDDSRDLFSTPGDEDPSRAVSSQDESIAAAASTPGGQASIAASAEAEAAARAAAQDSEVVNLATAGSGAQNAGGQ
jgi:hypothetical protein